MPRRARLSLPKIPWHIIQRANNCSECFYTEEDYHLYLDILKEQALRFDCKVHAYVLMTSHVHLLITPGKRDSAALLMKNLGQCYVQHINRIYKRSGTLWEGRFRSCLTQNADYVLSCYRYIESNPVRANVVNHPRDYPWSSYCVNAEEKSSELITPHDEYLALSKDSQSRRQAYSDLFNTHIENDIIKEIRNSTNGNFVLSDERFKEKVSIKLKKRVRWLKAGRSLKVD